MAINKLVSSIVATAVLACSASVSAATLKLSHNHDRNHPVHEAMQFMAKRAKELSGGSLNVRIYPDATLGSQRESTELLQIGALDMVKSNASELESFEPSYSAFNMPYLFRDRDHFYQVTMGAIGEKILASSEDKGFIGLTYYDAGSRNFYAAKPIQSPADLKGMKVRVQPSPTAVSMVEHMGASPTPLAYGELYTALDQGVVDSAENNITSFVTSRHGEVAKKFSFSEHAMIPDVLVISKITWDKLSADEQTALKQAARESSMEMKELWAASEDKNRKYAEEKMGVTFMSIDKTPFVKSVEPMYVALKKNNAELSVIVEEIRNTGV
ncbi:TRAP transporter substrate-binding protein [Thalassotalea sp. G20_0]|uniref:TRAP transporter substrate-binding protein n=1 Tax=Thalassotalea sp. G20_0 TaxID=2821093 RepID=UPI001ADB96C5|nr:TRAP transporter substrate-binding protein [Thalassotalea sp. G20_0]MBO9495127.1 TRAP transporter substrate-binding protein [Thalassotalea sp. G20_0]